VFGHAHRAAILLAALAIGAAVGIQAYAYDGSVAGVLAGALAAAFALIALVWLASAN
jgi:hypothetical protein